MPPLTTWDLLKNKARHVVTRPKAKKQAYFYGIFPEASDMSDDNKSSDDMYNSNANISDFNC